jgi:hypothetical protein
MENQSFIIVEDQHIPETLEWDGIFGMGWRGIGHTVKPVYQRMQEAGHPAIFALIPQRDRVAKLVLGHIPHDVKENTLVWTPCEKTARGSTGEDHHGFWIVSGGVAFTMDQPRQQKFLVDTGTNYILLVPTRYFLSFVHSLIPAPTFHRYCGMDAGMGNQIICDCRIGQNISLPPLKLYLGGQAFLIPFAEMFRKVPTTYGSDRVCLLEAQPHDVEPQSLDGEGEGLSSGTQRGVRFMESPLKANSMHEFWVLGGVFMEKFATIFDFDNNRVGFADLASDADNTHIVLRDFSVEQAKRSAPERTPSVDNMVHPSTWSLEFFVVVLSLMLTAMFFSLAFMLSTSPKQRQQIVQASDEKCDMEQPFGGPCE